jgi:hypothetical protein
MDIFIGIGCIMLVVFIGTYVLIKLALKGCDDSCNCNGDCNQGRQCTCKNKP